MREIAFELIVDKVAELCQLAAYELPEDVRSAIERAKESESNERSRDFLCQYLENADIAKRECMAICQDTGFAVYFVEIGEDVKISGGTIYDAINAGTAKGYKDGFLRKSIVAEPLFERKNTQDNTPAVIHLQLVKGDKLKIVMAPKGGGSENMSAIAMLKPSQGIDGVINFVYDTVVKAGGNPCPPTIVGVGIGGTFEKAALLAKQSLLRKTGEPNKDPRYAELEQRILQKINESKVGAQGLGGDITSFAVHIEFFPCHIASLPVAVNLNCHAARHAEVEL